MGSVGTNRKAALAACALLLLLSFGCAGSGGGTPRVFWVWGWENLAGVALAVVLLLLALGYMAATLLGDDKLKAWVRKEMGQAFYSVLILVVAVALVGTLDQWLRTLSIGGGLASGSWQSYVSSTVCCDPSSGSCVGPVRSMPCHIALATDYLQLLYETGRMNALAALVNYQVYAFISNMNIGVATLAFGVQAGLHFNPFAGLAAAGDYFSLLFDLAVKTMMLARAQQIFLEFVSYPMFGVMLSIGLVLRILYFTRKLGGLLVAIALVMYIIFPMFYVVSDAILWGFTNGWHPFGIDYDSATYLAPFSDPLTPATQTTFIPTDQAESVFNPSRQVNIDICNVGGAAGTGSCSGTPTVTCGSYRTTIQCGGPYGMCASGAPRYCQTVDSGPIDCGNGNFESTYDCGGTIPACTSISNQTSCFSVPGCSWTVTGGGGGGSGGAQGQADRTDAQLVRDNFRSRWDQIEGTAWGGEFGDLLATGTGNAFDKQGPIGSLATLMVFTLVTPFLALMTSLAAIKVFSPLIGGDVEISVLSRII
jgi:hypothetical protein